FRTIPNSITRRFRWILFPVQSRGGLEMGDAIVCGELDHVVDLFLGPALGKQLVVFLFRRPLMLPGGALLVGFVKAFAKCLISSFNEATTSTSGTTAFGSATFTA